MSERMSGLLGRAAWLAALGGILVFAAVGFAAQEPGAGSNPQPAGASGPSKSAPAPSSPKPDSKLPPMPKVAGGIGGRVSEYWLGVMSEPVPDALRAQLNLKDNQGLLVQEVAPESPAAAAGLQRFDILLKAADKPLTKIEDLIEALDAAKGQKLVLEVLRGGRSQRVEVVPAKRPHAAEISKFLPPPGPLGSEPWEALRKYLEQLRLLDPHSRQWQSRWFFMRPGVVVPGPGAIPNVPSNVTITITKEGNQPAKITVTRDKEKWEVTENELDKLPAELRPHVTWMIRYPEFPMSVGPAPAVPAPPKPPAPPALKPELRQQKRMELRGAPDSAEAIQKVTKELEAVKRQTEQIGKQHQELRKELDRQLEELRKMLRELAPPAAPGSKKAPATS